MNHNNAPSIGKLVRTTFFVYVVVAIVLFLFSVIALKRLCDEIIHDSLKAEANYFWNSVNDDNYPNLIQSKGFNSFYTGTENGYQQDVPENLRQLNLGFHEIDEADRTYTIYVSESHNRRLYLKYEHDHLNIIVHQIYLYQALMFVIFMVVMYLLSVRWLIKIINPMMSMASELKQKGVNSSVEVFDNVTNSQNAGQEVKVLSSSLCILITRINELITRERNFTRDASHEMRSSMTVMRFACENISDDETLSAFSRDNVERLERSIKNLDDLISGLLMLARDTEQTYETEKVQISKVLLDVIESQTPIIEANNNTITTMFIDETIVDAPPQAVFVILTNLINNAAKYTNNGTIKVTARQRYVIVEDTGSGIPQDKLKKIFDVFQRGERQHSDGEGVSTGFGIGLAIVKRLSERFDWKINMESEVNKGTTITIEF